MSLPEPMRIVGRRRWTVTLLAVIGIALLLSSVFVAVVYRIRLLQEEQVGKEVDDTVGKWNSTLSVEPWESEVPPDLDVMIRDDFEFLDLRSLHLTEDLRERLRPLRRVQWLRLSTEATAHDLPWIGKLTQLRGVSLAGAQLAGADFSCFQNLQSLQLLDLCGAHISAQHFATLPRLPRLHCILFKGHEITDQHILHLARLRLPALRQLTLYDTCVSDTAFIQLCNNYNLTYLTLYDSGYITGKSVEALGRMTKLRDLEVTYSGLSPRGGVTPEVQRLMNMLPHCAICCTD
jgi:hypothetical protein